MNRACTIDELDGVVRFRESIACDERKESYCLACTSRHFEEAVTFGIQSSLEFNHIRVLLWVYVIVGKVHCYVFYIELHVVVFRVFRAFGGLERERERVNWFGALNLALCLLLLLWYVFLSCTFF